MTHARAGFWRRFAAVLVDSALFLVVELVLIVALGRSGGLALASLVAVVYWAYFEGTSGQTVGKRALGIRVVDAQGRGSIGIGRAVVRYLGRILSSIAFLGYLWMLWDGQKQTWHDKLAGSYVVRD